MSGSRAGAGAAPPGRTPGPRPGTAPRRLPSTGARPRPGPATPAPDVGVAAVGTRRSAEPPPHRAGPADLRLVPPALAAWAAAALALGAPVRWTAAGVAGCLLAAGSLAVAARFPLARVPSGGPRPPSCAPLPAAGCEGAGGGGAGVPSGPGEVRPTALEPVHRAVPGHHRAPPRGRWGPGHPPPCRDRPPDSGRRPDPAGNGPRHSGGLSASGCTAPRDAPARPAAAQGLRRAGVPAPGPVPGRPAPSGGPATGGGTHRPTGGGLRAASRLRTTAAGVLLCAASGAAVAGLHTADLHRGPLPELARIGAHVTVDAAVVSDPRRARPQGGGAAHHRPTLVLDAEVTRVTTGREGTVEIRTPVLILVSPGSRDDAWLRLLPTTRLRLSGGLALPGQPDGRIAAVLRVRGGDGPTVVAPPTGVQRFAGSLRAGLRAATDGLAPDARALLPGLVVGDTSRVPEDLQSAFEATDLTHLVAVSGSNLTIVLMLLVGPPGRALLAERGGAAPRLGVTLRGTAVLGGALTLVFVVVCRPEPSVLRAAACGLVTLLAIATGRRRSLLPALAAAVLLLVLYDPRLARSYGFLLSVLATGALLIIAPGWGRALRERGVPARLAEPLAASAAAQAVCGPVVAVFAARASLVGVPCNLLVEAAVAPATVLGFSALAAAPVAPWAAEALAWCAGWPAGWIAAVARRGAELPGAGAPWPGGPTGGLLLAGVTGAVLLIVRNLSRRPLACVVCAALLCLVIARPAPLGRLVTGWPPADWSYAMCDVGQGDLTVLAAGGGSAVVVDAGPDPGFADRCLTQLGVTHVPLLVVTHFHADHVAGLPGVLDGRSVGAIQTTSLQEPEEQAEFVHRTAERAGIPVSSATPGERRRAGPLEWEVLWPRLTPAPVSGEPNDASVTLLARAAGGLSLLLLGDLEPPAQQALLRARPDLPRVDVLKVAHHGSAYQHPGLLAAVRPRLALISCGRDNPYGHPSARTLALLRAQGALVLRTDGNGSVAVGGSGEGLRVTAEHGPAESPSGPPAGDRRPPAHGAGPVARGRLGPWQPTPTRRSRPRRRRRDHVTKRAPRPLRPGGVPGCRPRRSAPTSGGSVPSARTGPTPRPSGCSRPGTLRRFRSRTSRSTCGRRSFWTSGGLRTRSSNADAGASATNSTGRSPPC